MADNNRTAIVTGAGKGIGAAIAARLAADGFAVVVNYSASAEAAEQVVGSITASGGRARAVRADVADPLAVTAMFDAAEATFGPVDLLVNNAGISRTAPLAQVTDTDWQAHLAVNLTGTFNGLREGARRRAHRQPVDQHRRHLPARARRLCRHQGGGGGAYPRPRKGTGAARRHRQRGCPRPGRHRAVLHRPQSVVRARRWSRLGRGIDPNQLFLRKYQLRVINSHSRLDR